MDFSMANGALFESFWKVHMILVDSQNYSQYLVSLGKMSQWVFEWNLIFWELWIPRGDSLSMYVRDEWTKDVKPVFFRPVFFSFNLSIFPHS